MNILKSIADYNSLSPKTWFWGLPLCIGLATLIAQMSDLPESTQALDFNESNWMTLFIGQFGHLSWTHLLLNLTGLGLVTWGLASIRPPREGFLLLSASLLLTPAYLLAVEPIGWYLGLSGALHGYFSGLLVLSLYADRQRSLRLNWPLWIMLAGLVSKLLIEAKQPFLQSELIEGPVAHAAHRAGAFAGLAVAFFYLVLRRFRLDPSGRFR